MLNMFEVIETNNMIEHERLDVRTITMGISLLDCCDSDLDSVNKKIYEKITRYAENLVSTGEAIARDFGVPIVNKRISVTPIGLVGGCACKSPEDFVTIARTLDRAAHQVGVNFIGGYSALVSKGMTTADENLIRSGSFGRYRAGMQLCQCRFYQNRTEYGCSAAYGRGDSCRGKGYKRSGFFRLRKAGGVLQCAG